MNKFRPQDLPKSDVIKQRLKFGQTYNYNWQSSVKWYPSGWKFNHRVLGNIHSRMHYLACHSPAPIQKAWEAKYKVFMDRHFGNTSRASMRYLNRWSCHSWL